MARTITQAVDTAPPRKASSRIMEQDGEEMRLIEAARDGDHDAYGRLVTLHQDRVFACVVRHVRDEHAAQDLAQEVFVQAFRAIHSYETRARFSTWLYRIAMNLITSRHRHESAQKRGGGKGRASLDAEGVPEPDAHGRTPGDQVAAAETGEIVRAAIDELEEEYKSVVILRDLNGLSYEEVAEVLDIAPGTVRSRLHRGRERLREKLKHLME